MPGACPYLLFETSTLNLYDMILVYLHIYIYMFHAILFLFQDLGRIVFDGAPASFLGSLNLKPAWKSSK